MRKTLLMLAIVLMSTMAFGQSYYIINKAGTEAAYNFVNTTGAKVLVPAGSNDVLSAATNIPFAWNFYGTPVTQYKASDNGYITFDVSSTTSMKANTTLPDASAPLNAIFAYWDDLEFKSIPGQTSIKTEARSFTYGTAPNRVHVIQYFTASLAGVTTATSFMYFAIRLHEGGNFDIVHNYSASAPVGTGTVGVQNADGSMGTMVTGSPNLDLPNKVANYTANTSDKVFMFRYGTQHMYDLTVSNISVPSPVSTSANTSITGTIANFGTAIVNSFTLNYTIDGGATVSDNMTGVSIAPSGGTYNFTSKTPWTGAKAGEDHTIKVWASNINANTDEDMSNDAMEKTVYVNNGVAASKIVMLEEGSGTWCQWCPDGHVVQDNLFKENLGKVIAVVHHNGDKMVNSQSTAFNNVYGGSYPYGTVDRKLFDGQTTVNLNRGDWGARVLENMNSTVPAKVNIADRNWDENTRVLSYKVTVEFLDYAKGDMRIGSMITEDNVRGKGTGFDQYIASPLVNDPNFIYYGYPNPMVGYIHDNVALDAPGGIWGKEGSIPENVKPGDKFEASFSYKVPPTVKVEIPETSRFLPTGEVDGQYKPEDIHMIGFLAYYHATDVTKRQVVNAWQSKLMGWAAGVDDEPAAGVDAQLYPNPSSGITNVSFSVEKMTNVSVDIFNSLGQKVQNVRTGNFANGSHTVYFDASTLENGVYFVNITSGDQVTTKRLVVLK